MLVEIWLTVNITFLSHCWWRYLKRILVFSVVITVKIKLCFKWRQGQQRRKTLVFYLICFKLFNNIHAYTTFSIIVCSLKLFSFNCFVSHSNYVMQNNFKEHTITKKVCPQFSNKKLYFFFHILQVINRLVQAKPAIKCILKYTIQVHVYIYTQMSERGCQAQGNYSVMDIW